MNPDINTNSNETRQTNASLFRAELEKLQTQTEQNDTAEITDQNTSNETELENEPERSNDDASNTNDLDDNDEEQNVNDPDDDSDNSHMIPKGRFNKVLQQKKALEKQAEEERLQRIKLQTELELYNRAMEKFVQTKNNTANENEETFEPLDTDAHKFYLAQQQRLEQELHQLKQKTEQYHIMRVLDEQGNSYSKIQPDFNKALDYLVDKYVKSNELVYDTAEDAKNAALQQLGSAARKLLDKNENVAKKFYNMAKELGYNESKTNLGPNLKAINDNMAKSKIADLNSAPISPSNKAANLTKLEEFSKHYKPGDAKSFHEILQELKKQ